MKRSGLFLILFFLSIGIGILANSLVVQGIGFGGQGESDTCISSEDCATGLDCVGGVCILEEGGGGGTGCSSGLGCSVGQWCSAPGSSGSCQQVPPNLCCQGPGCGGVCAPPMCGDGGSLDPGEQCDDGNHVSGDGCDPTCHSEICGNSIFQPGDGEECDDGNTINGDGCSSTCQEEPGYSCNPDGVCGLICSQPDQIIMRLSSQTNAHGELWNGAGDYFVNVCYEEIFGVEYEGANPHVCSAQNDNLVLKLSSSTNAHAQTPESTTYTTNVCFGDLDCRSTTASCNADEREVVTLSSQSNAHLETATANGFVGGSLICCKIGTPGVSTGPEAIISYPVHRHIYFTGVNIAFDGSSSTVPQGETLSYLWTVTKNGATEIIPSPTTATFDKIFTTPGMRTVTLKVTSASGSDEAQIAVLVVSNDKRVFTFIEKPFHKEILSTQGSPYGLIFSANDTYAVNVTSGACPSINCLGGYCIDHTDNVPTTCTGTTLPVAGAPSQTTPGAGNFSNLYFNWTFGQGSQIVANFGNFSHRIGIFLYESKSVALGDKWIKLNVSYDETLPLSSLTVLSDFNNRTFTLGQCINNGNQFIETEAGEYVATHDTLDSQWCAGADGTIGGGDDCCPGGHQCTINGCQPSGITSCEDYTDENDCEDDTSGVTESPLSPGYQALVDSCVAPNDVGSVNCVWDDFGTGTEECKVELSCHKGFSSDPNAPLCTGSVFSCDYTSSEAECDASGFTTIDYLPIPPTTQAQGTCYAGAPLNECEPISAEVPCGLLNFEVSFFNYSQFILSALAIIFAYLLINFRKRE